MFTNPKNFPRAESYSPDMSWDTLERMDWQVWSQAILLIVVLGAGLVTFMFPAVLWPGNETLANIPRRALIGFTVLLTLALVHLLQKNRKVRLLQRKLYDAQAALAVAGNNAAVALFQSLPTVGQFRDTLAMEYRRASTSATPVSVLLFIDASAALETMGRLTHLLQFVLRYGETLYRISETSLGVILPGMKFSQCETFADRVEALSGIAEQCLQIRVAAYPEKASSLTELEGILRQSQTGEKPALSAKSSERKTAAFGDPEPLWRIRL